MSVAHEKSVISSALWAAYGDALGFITELADTAGVKRRAQSATVAHTIPWRRLVGGKFGANVQLPAGCYSDDTQLRLAGGRAIRSDGYFDVEAFAKIELPIWLSYALGGGLSTKAAANELISPNVAWFTNFFESRSLNYFNGGGNGAAMRIQPHVWASVAEPFSAKTIQSVVRNAVCTHGHVRGIGGAVLHAEALHYCFERKEVPGPQTWRQFVKHLKEISQVVREDRELSAFWLPVWESRSGLPFDRALGEMMDECFIDLDSIENVLDRSPAGAYESAVDRIGARTQQLRGTGTKTAMIAMLLAWLFKEQPPESALITAANFLGSDTDTIGTMAGAMLGAVAHTEPQFEIQDRSYITAEASRLFRIATKQLSSSFEYPEVMNWRAPRVSADVVVKHRDKVVLSGLGRVEATSEIWQARKHDGTGWQWLKLHFGQTVLAKRRSDLPAEEDPSHQDSKVVTSKPLGAQNASQHGLFSQRDNRRDDSNQSSIRGERPLNKLRSLDELTADVIRSRFNEELIGRHIMELAERERGIELAVAYVSIVAKAKIARAQVSAKRVESRS
jgi:ADP-ribosylglycohydrolase